MRQLRARISRSLRHKLLVLVLLPILLIAPATVGFAIFWSGVFSHEQLLNRIDADLVVAHDHFTRLQHRYLHQLEQLAGSYGFLTAYAEGDGKRIQDQLSAIRDTTGFSFVHVTDLHGRWLYSPESSQTGASKRSPLQRQVTNFGTPGVGIEVYTPTDLAKESAALAESAVIPIVQTPHTSPLTRKREDRSLVVRAIVPVRDLKGTIVGMIEGGVVLNGTFEMVDAIRDLVFPEDSLPEGSIGTVAVFLGDVGVSTNVPHRDGSRALGTRASRAVRDAVLVDGRTWVARSFVVNDWFVSAYRPLVNVYGQRIGMLYTGFLEAPFRNAYLRTLAISLLLVFIGTGFAAALAIRGATSIFKPIEAIARVVRALQAGDEDKRIGKDVSEDEIGELAREFDRTLDLLKLRNEEVRVAAERLETKVAERTRELREKNARLEETIDLLKTTRQQLVAAEKLAALGELTAGVAHEINNPIAVIQGNLELLRRELGGELGASQVEFGLIMAQIERIHTIVDKLLSYSRPSTRRGLVSVVDLRRLVADTLLLVDHELKRKRLTAVTEHRETLEVRIDARELQQVLVNLLVNAVEASPAGARIEIETRDWERRGVVISVRDHGVGIAPEHLPRVFDPFFTTRKSSGTGLGLSVSIGLVQGYGGDIKARSEPGEGAVFEVYLLTEPVLGETLEPEPTGVDGAPPRSVASRG